MTQEDRQILLKDLSSRLPYGVRYRRFAWDDKQGEECISAKIYSISPDGFVRNYHKDESIVPVGRASGKYIGGTYDMFGCYCQNPENMYSFLIDEKGNIYKCSFGVLCSSHLVNLVITLYHQRDLTL